MSSMLVPSFRIELGNSVVSGQVTMGMFDGRAPSIAGVTGGNSVFIHQPQREGQLESGLGGGNNGLQTKQLSINRNITAIGCGDLDLEGRQRDVLLVGSNTNLMAYDVEDNRDIFFKDVSDGVTVLCTGHVPEVKDPLAIVGGNCSIQGFDREGNEAYWYVTGDNVTAMCLLKKDRMGAQTLMVGSEDFVIRKFYGEDMVGEITETDVVTNLCPVDDANHHNLFGFSLASGHIGVYNDDTRIWNAKSKHKCTSLTSFDLDEDGVPEILSGWHSGKFEVRNVENGSLVYKDNLTNQVAKVLVGDYRMDGREGVVVVSTEGEIRGYIAKERGQDDGMHSLTDSHALKEQLIKLTHQRNGLLLDLANYENSIKSSKKGEGEGRELANVPLDTNISFGLRYTDTMDKLFLVLRTNNDTHVKAVVALSDALFENESMVEIPAKPSTSLEIKLSLNKNIAAAVLVKAVVGYPGSTQDHVFQEQYQLPRFSNFCPVPNGKAKEPSGKLVFTVNERANRVMMWISRAFYLGNIGDLPKHLSGVDMSFKNIREEGKDLRLTMQGSEGGVMTIACDDMELAGDIVQDMCATLKIKTLEAEADFQSEEKEFLKVLDEINDYKSIAKKLSAEIADSTQILKNMIVQAEDARINAAMDIMCSVYAQVFNLNQELISEYRKRETNHQNLAKSLKVVQKMIQKASRLRMGAVQSRVVKLCREAMKPLNPKKMLNILKTGGGAGY